MDFREYLAILIRNWWLVILSILLAGGGLWFYAIRQPLTFMAIASISLVKQPEAVPQAGTYQYDAYYNLQSTQTLAQMIIGWVVDPVAVTQIYASAGVSLPKTDSISKYERLIKNKPLTGGTLEIVTTSGTAEEAERLANATTELIQSRLDQLVSEKLLDPIKVFRGAAISQAENSSEGLFGGVGIALGLMLGILLAFLKEGLRSPL